MYKVDKQQFTIQCNTISGKGTALLRKHRKDCFQYNASKRAYSMHPTLHTMMEKFGDTVAEV